MQPWKSLCEGSWGVRRQGVQLELGSAQGQGLHLIVLGAGASRALVGTDAGSFCESVNTRLEGDRLLLATRRRWAVAGQGGWGEGL